MQRIYIDLGRDPHTAHAALTGSAAPSLAGVLGAPLDLAVAFFRNGEQEALASGATGKLVLKKSGARAGDALLLDTTMTAEGSGSAAIYKFSGTLSSAELISALAENDSLTLKASVAWTEPGADERVALDCDFVLHNSATRPDDAAPANTAASELWLDDRVIRYLPAVVGLTGGGGTKLDGLATTAKDAGEAVAVFDDSASSVLRVYELVAGSDAESAPDVIRPDDFHASTNAKVWLLRGDATAATLAAHTASTSNPHAVTKAQVGLGNCENTSDASKPVSTATQTALDAKEAAQTAASQAEAEAGTESAIRKFSPLRIAQAIAALGGSGSAVTTPKVLHVTTAGNDTTGDGSLAAPYLTAQKAFDVAFAGSGDFVLQLGVGAFGSISCESGWPARIFLRGAGASVCSLASISSATAAEGHTAAAIDLRSDKSVTVSGVSASGTGSLTASGAGGSAGAVSLVGVTHGSVEAIGGDGGPESDPGISGDGGSGGDGGGITLRDCVKSVAGDISAAGGSPGAGGAGGAAANVSEVLCEHRQSVAITCADRLAIMCLLSSGDTVSASGTNTETGCVTE